MQKSNPMSLDHPLLPTSPRIEIDQSQFPPDSVEGYAHILKNILLDGIVSPGENIILSEHREQNGISMETHFESLKLIGWTEENWEAAIEMGKATLPDEIYGGSTYKQVYYIPKLHEKYKPIYARGLIVAPHLRQWYTYTENGKPDMFWREKEERKATPLELFFDLCFVTTVFKLSHAIEDSSFSILVYIVMYGSFWRVWFGVTSYSTRYEHEDWLHPLAYCTTMLGALFMTTEIEGTFSLLTGTLTHSTKMELVGFAVSFLFASFPLFVLYLLATITELSGASYFIFNSKNQYLNRKKTYHPLQMLIALTISYIPWIITAVNQVTDPLPYWGTSLLFMEISSHIIDAYNHYSAPICVEHWGERFSLFVMLHLGETMFAIATDRGGAFDSIIPLIATLFGLIIPFAFRRVYFEVEGTEPKNPHALRRWFTLRLYTFCHLILCMAIIAYATSFTGLQTVSDAQTSGTDINITYYTQLDKNGEILTNLENTNHSEENATCSETYTALQLYLIFREVQWIFCGALALMIFMVCILSLLSKPEEEYEKKYYIYKSQNWRTGTRIILIIFLLIIPKISYNTITVNAFETICIGGSFYFVWALVESFIVLRKGAHKRLIKHDPHYVEMSAMAEKNFERI